jgi:hypothetical protein
VHKIACIDDNSTSREYGWESQRAVTSYMRVSEEENSAVVKGKIVQPNRISCQTERIDFPYYVVL